MQCVQGNREDTDFTEELIALHFKARNSQRAKQQWDTIYSICINRDYDKEAWHIITLCWAIRYVLWWGTSVYLWVHMHMYAFLCPGYHTQGEGRSKMHGSDECQSFPAVCRAMSKCHTSIFHWQSSCNVSLTSAVFDGIWIIWIRNLLCAERKSELGFIYSFIYVVLYMAAFWSTKHPLRISLKALQSDQPKLISGNAF